MRVFEDCQPYGHYEGEGMATVWAQDGVHCTGGVELWALLLASALVVGVALIIYNLWLGNNLEAGE